MSISQNTVFNNPENSTNLNDPHKGGWYKINNNTSNLALRVNYSNIGLAGEIRLNTTVMPNVFQGNNGSAWVNFNSLQGPTGPSGTDFTNAVNFNNLGSNVAPGLTVSLASVFASTFVDVSQSISNVNVRSLKGSVYDVNSNLSINSIILQQNSNVITITPQPLPYSWSFSNGFNTVSYLKNSPSDNIFYSWGETSFWVVQTGATVLKGQAVRLTKDTITSNIVITPVTYTYTTLAGVSPLLEPFNMLGIALNTVNTSNGDFCKVCTKGITTVLFTSTNNTTDFTSQTSITSGVDGIVGKNGSIFSTTTGFPTVDYIRAGYFLETKTGPISDGSYVLFYVDPKVQSS